MTPVQLSLVFIAVLLFHHFFWWAAGLSRVGFLVYLMLLYSYFLCCLLLTMLQWHNNFPNRINKVNLSIYLSIYLLFKPVTGEVNLDVTPTTQLNVVPDQIHPLMATSLLRAGSALPACTHWILPNPIRLRWALGCIGTKVIRYSYSQMSQNVCSVLMCRDHI